MPHDPTTHPTILELYCGIGGCAAALPPTARVAAALDINTRALTAYRHNFPHHPAQARTLDNLPTAELAALGADLWWLSPPCQPFTHRGLRRDADDPRARSLLAMIDQIAAVRPHAIALENVPGFEGSRCHSRLRETLDRAGYHVRETLLCPTDLGVPNRRRRFYLAARLDTPPAPWGTGQWTGARLPDLVDHTLHPSPPDALRVPREIQERFPHALHIVDPHDPDAVTACFTAAYGRSPVRSGSYLRLPPPADDRLRRFAPHEILRLLGFPASYTLPPDLPPSKAWPLVGNSLSVPAVRAVLAAVLT